MRMSSPGLKYLTELEGGMELEPYNDGYGYLTIGVGHLICDGEENLHFGITYDQGLELLADDVLDAEQAVERLVEVVLVQNQFDALCCFVFNIGITAFRKSTLLRLLNLGDYGSVPAQMARWRKAGGRVSKGLIKRRRETSELWSTGDYVRDWD